VIQILGRDGTQTINQVADRIAMDRGGTSRAIARLEKRGLIRRLAHGGDRRRSPVELNDAGLALHAQVAAFANAREARLTQSLSATEREVLSALLARLEVEAVEMLTSDWRPEPL
jgi:DNA-binding MarR family transcriptional regulator